MTTRSVVPGSKTRAEWNTLSQVNVDIWPSFARQLTRSEIMNACIPVYLYRDVDLSHRRFQLSI